ncbi:NRDE family protein [Salegentibacter chungangensis]|uniref:NRDE family protein n=1 Tax=Salegentibacter chungangensis TaxID=1335724 RepID=A0ABW3NS46_9FLAO
MCTISLVPLSGFKNSFILTSNRDEAVGRETLPPEFKSLNGVKALFPQDKVAGGTWIGVSEYKHAICLMNGAFEKHERKDNYRKSRGLIVTDLLEAQDAVDTIENYNFQDIEPFTLILVDWKKGLEFYQLVWDGQKKHFKQLELRDHIWSSSPLYDKTAKRMRKDWFEEFKRSKELTAENILKFHHNAGTGDKNTDLIIDRGFLKTQSITQIKSVNSEIDFWYENLKDHKVTKEKWNLVDSERSA